MHSVKLLPGVLVTLLLLLSPRSVEAQTIAGCPDCAKITPCFLCPINAECCVYETTDPEKTCAAYKSRGWTIHELNSSPCGVWKDPDSGNSFCQGPKCGQEYDVCANGGCTEGFVPASSTNANCQTRDECGCCTPYSPLVIDLRGDGIRMTAAADGALFDINGLGRVFWVAFPSGADDAWLALDRNGDGTIDNGSELFGNTTRLATGDFALHGFVALSELDTNHDGVVSAADATFSQLQLWFDRDRNGRSAPSELLRITESPVMALSTDYRESRRRDAFGNEFRLRATAHYAGGKQKAFYDVYPTMAPVEGAAPLVESTCSSPAGLRVPTQH